MCSSSRNFVSFPSGKPSFVGVQPLLEQYISESTVNKLNQKVYKHKEQMVT